MDWAGGVGKSKLPRFGGSKETPYARLNRFWHHEDRLPGRGVILPKDCMNPLCCFETKKFWEEIEPGKPFKTFLVGTQENPASFETAPLSFKKVTSPLLLTGY
jgi:hypothetical protein